MRFQSMLQVVWRWVIHRKTTPALWNVGWLKLSAASLPFYFSATVNPNNLVALMFGKEPSTQQKATQLIIPVLGFLLSHWIPRLVSTELQRTMNSWSAFVVGLKLGHSKISLTNLQHGQRTSKGWQVPRELVVLTDQVVFLFFLTPLCHWLNLIMEWWYQETRPILDGLLMSVSG